MNPANSLFRSYTHRELRQPATEEALNAASNHLNEGRFNKAMRIYFLLTRNENCIPAKKALGTLFESTKKTNDMIAYFSALPIEEDRNIAFATMGYIFKYGLGVKPNTELAFECFMMANVSPKDQVSKVFKTRLLRGVGTT